MSLKVATGPAALGVERSFEGNRFAEDYQVQVYELAVGQQGLPNRETLPAGSKGSEAEPIIQGGVAA